MTASTPDGLPGWTQPYPAPSPIPYGGPGLPLGQGPYPGPPSPYPSTTLAGPLTQPTYHPGPHPYAGGPGPMPYGHQPGPMPYPGWSAPVLYASPPVQLRAPLVWHGPPVAPIGRRLVARLVDMVVCGAVLVGLAFVLGDRFGSLFPTGTVTRPGYVYAVNGGGLLVILGVTLINEVLLASTLGGSVGKLAMGLRVAGQANAKVPAAPGWLIGRWFLLTVTFALCLIPGVVMALSPLWAGPMLQGWHDTAFRTVVVRKPDATT